MRYSFEQIIYRLKANKSRRVYAYRRGWRTRTKVIILDDGMFLTIREGKKEILYRPTSYDMLNNDWVYAISQHSMSNEELLKRRKEDEI